MKDYYQILGVEEEASGEEIQARWAELVADHHLDLERIEGENGRISEIIEAYEILGNESARVEYDLERDLKRSVIKRARSRKERRINIPKVILSVGILFFSFIVGLIIFRWSHLAINPKSKAHYEIDKILEEKTASQSPPAKIESKVIEEKEVPKEIKKEVIPQERKKIVSVSPQRSPEKILPKSEVPVKAEEEVLAKEEPRPVEEPGPQVLAKSEAPVRVEKEVPKEVPREIPKEPTGVTLHPGEKLAVTLLLPLANEEEVKQFFSRYIDRYDQKDIDGFVSFFSSKAVQNQKEGLKEIRNIYTKFFDESRQLRYDLEGMKIEIYQNAADVKARFRVDQILKKGGGEKVWTGTIHWVLVREDGALKIISLNYQNEKSP
jgi:curved DNA-binding protein CbpA